MKELKLPPEYHPGSQETIQAVLAVAGNSGYQLYLVGGYVRDRLLKRLPDSHSPADLDFVVKGGSAVVLARQLADRLPGHFVLLDESNDTARVVLDGAGQIDLAGCVGGSIEIDVQRRDFTVNALLWDPDQPDRILDLVGGCEDLEKRVLRAISESAFVEDPLRLLRAFRFSASLGFVIESNTFEMVRRQAAGLANVASERVSYELFSIMETGEATQSMLTMGHVGLLEIIFPEITDMHKVPPNSFHHLCLYEHSLEALAQVEKGFEQLPDWAGLSCRAPLSSQLSRLAATKIAGLLHDIGKPRTWHVQEDGRHTFIGHDKLGAEMILETSKRLKWSKPFEKFISNMIRWHLRPGALFHQGTPTERAIHRFYRTVGADISQLILLALADFRATRGPGLQDRDTRAHLENQLIELLQRYVVFTEGRKNSPRLLDGSDVMNLLKISPGKVVGELLEQLEEAQGLQEVLNKRQAEAFLLELYHQKYCT